MASCEVFGSIIYASMPPCRITFIITLSLFMVLVQTYSYRDDADRDDTSSSEIQSNDRHNVHGKVSVDRYVKLKEFKVPFFYIPPSTAKDGDTEPPFRNLYRGLEKYKENIDAGIQGLILSMEMARKTEWVLFPNEFNNNSRNSNGNSRKNHNNPVFLETNPLLLSSRLEERIRRTAESLEEDYFVLEKILRPFDITYGLPYVMNGNWDKDRNENGGDDDDGNRKGGGHPTKIVNDDPLDAQKASSYDTAMQVITHIVRDWSVEGKRSRESLYHWSIEQLNRYSPAIDKKTTFHDGKSSSYDNNDQMKMKCHQRHHNKVLIPGSGLGRLAYDVSLAGYTVEANEISMVMAAAASAFLNGLNGFGKMIRGKVHPWAFDFLINEVDSSDRYQTVDFPDVDDLTHNHASVNGDYTAGGGGGGSISYTIGDFVEIYSQNMYEAKFSSVVTCFFIDTASNIYEYILVIRNVLQSEGVWVNVGPLQWHQNAKLHPSGDELRVMVESMGFRVESWSVDDEAINYRHDDRNEKTRHTKYEGYRPLRFVAVLPSATRLVLQGEDKDTAQSVMDIRRVLSNGMRNRRTDTRNDNFATSLNSESSVTINEVS